MSFCSTLGKCVDLLPHTCFYMKTKLSCKNSCVKELCKDTCNDCTTGTYNYYADISENLKKVYKDFFITIRVSIQLSTVSDPKSIVSGPLGVNGLGGGAGAYFFV